LTSRKAGTTISHMPSYISPADIALLIFVLFAIGIVAGYAITYRREDYGHQRIDDFAYQLSMLVATLEDLQEIRGFNESADRFVAMVEEPVDQLAGAVLVMYEVERGAQRTSRRPNPQGSTTS